MNLELVLVVVFWASVIIIFYNYIGYGLIVWFIIQIKDLISQPKQVLNSGSIVIGGGFLPKVTLVVAAYNEEKVIEEKILNTLALDYPEDRLSLIFITDGSTDRTPNIVSKYSRIRLLHLPVRAGKTAALNRAMREVDTPITIFCDANTLLNGESIRRIVAHYANPKVGGVAGEKRIFTKNQAGEPIEQEGIYWKYESALKKLDSQLYTVVGAAGELFSIRTHLWEELDDNVILDDFVISIGVNLRGFRVVYEPDAYALELPSKNLREEKKRKIRIVAGAFQSMIILKPVFNFFKHPVLFFQFFSHRFLRWAVIPVALPLLFLSSVLLAASQELPIYKLAVVVQVVFYAMAALGAISKKEGILYQAGRTCYYVVFMNVMVFPGFFRFLRNTQSATWEKADRESAITL